MYFVAAKKRKATYVTKRIARTEQYAFHKKTLERYVFAKKDTQGNYVKQLLVGYNIIIKRKRIIIQKQNYMEICARVCVCVIGLVLSWSTK